jgi:hypothetical protein
MLVINEYNIFVMLFKSAVFGETTLFEQGSASASNILGYTISVSLFYVNILLALVSFIGAIVLIVKKKYLRDSTVTGFFAILWVVVMAFYFKFCLDYPFTCSLDFPLYRTDSAGRRLFFLGKLIDYLTENKEKQLCNILKRDKRSRRGFQHIVALQCSVFWEYKRT